MISLSFNKPFFLIRPNDCCLCQDEITVNGCEKKLGLSRQSDTLFFFILTFYF